MTPENRPDADQVRHYPAHLNPDNVPAKPPRWEIWAIVLIVAAISALLTAGILQLLDRKSNSEPPAVQEKVRLVGVSQYLAVIVVGAAERREIKLLDTQNLRVQDVTRGQASALTAGLSPNGKYLTYMSDSPDGTNLSVVEVQGGEPVPLAASALLKAGEDEDFSHLVICKWTNISWSSDSSRFLIFGCDKDDSVIVVVSIGKTLEPRVLPDTRANQMESREAIWLNDGEILFTQQSDTTGKTIVEKISADSKDSLVLIYGE